MILVAASGLGTTPGCTAPEPPAASFGVASGEQDAGWKPVLDARDRAEVRSAFAGLAAGHEIVERPGPAPDGMRFRDVPAAAGAATAAIEAAVMRTRVRDDGSLLFTLRTIEDRPGELLVRPTGDARVYEAEAWIGRFPEDERNRERVARLLEAFDRELRAFGRERAFD